MIPWEEVIQNALSVVDFQLRKLQDEGEPYVVYLYGADGEKATDELVDRLMRNYPTHYADVLKRKGKTAQELKDHVRGHFAYDCSGLVCAITSSPWDMSSAGLYGQTKDHRTTPVNGPEASLLWKPGHVGLDIGTGYLVEMVGEFDDLRVSRIRSRDFESSGRLPWIDYTGATNY